MIFAAEYPPWVYVVVSLGAGVLLTAVVGVLVLAAIAVSRRRGDR